MREHWAFALVLALATAVRVVTMLAYWGVLWFPDSNSYLAVAVSPQTYPVRPVGYSFFLRLLMPLHSFAVVAIVQHLMCLAIGTLTYLLLRVRFRVNRWVSVLATLPVFFDAYQLQLEHLLLSDVLFELLIVAAAVIVLWRPDGLWHIAGAGLCIGLAAVTRSIALPLLALFLLYLLVRRHWRSLVSLTAACALPVAAYMLWFHGTWGVYATSNSDGLFLYSRTMAFADCSVLHPTAEQRKKLCTDTPKTQRQVSPNYLWHEGYLGTLTNNEKFTPANNAMAEDFARKAIIAQPGDYLHAGWTDLNRTFAWDRSAYPTIYSSRLYYFLPKLDKLYMGSRPVPDTTLGEAVHTYLAQPDADGLAVVDPGYSAFMMRYQQLVVLHGTLLWPLLIGGAVMLIARLRVAAEAALPWLCGLALLVAPPFVAAFGYRYVIPAVPLVCLGLALTFRPRPHRHHTHRRTTPRSTEGGQKLVAPTERS